MSTRRTPLTAALVATAALLVAACGGGDEAEPDDSVASEVAETTGSASDDATTNADDEADDPAPTDESDDPDTPAETVAPSTTTPGPQGVPLVDGVAPIALLGPPEVDAGIAPLFSWAPVDGASVYRLAIVGPEGPIWSWTGDTTEVFLGGLDFEQPPGWAGPQLVEGSCWSVTAADAAGDVIAVSSYVPVAPGPTAGPPCTPPGS